MTSPTVAFTYDALMLGHRDVFLNDPEQEETLDHPTLESNNSILFLDQATKNPLESIGYRQSDNVHEEHPERPARIQTIFERLDNSGLLDTSLRVPGRLATRSELELVHSSTYCEQVAQWPLHDSQTLCGLSRAYDSVYLCAETRDSAEMAVGATIDLIQFVATGSAKTGFAIVRPPGHHAEHENPMGFCIYNNIAIATKCLLANSPTVRRVLILDWDVHHGNGTQDAFAANPNVLYVSIHRYDNGLFYPHGRPKASHVYVGEVPDGMGTTINVPWPSGGFGDSDYLYAFSRLIIPVAREFNPDIVLVSAGFDAALGDPIGGCNVTPLGYAHMTHQLMSLAPTVLVLEGGYDLEAITDSAEACFRVLKGQSPIDLPRALLKPSNSSLAPSIAAIRVVEAVVQAHGNYWKCLYPKTVTLPFPSHPNLSIVSLQDITSIYWKHVCQERLGLSQYPINDQALATYYQGRIFSSDPKVSSHTSTQSLQPLIIFVHESGPLLLGGCDRFKDRYWPISNQIEPTNSAHHLPFQALLERALELGYMVFDLQVPSMPSQLRQTDAGPPEQLSLQHDMFLYLWDDFVSKQVVDSTKVFIVGAGFPIYSIANLIEKRDVENKIGGIVMFSATLYLPIICMEKSDWYQKKSLVYIPTARPRDTAIPTHPSFGSCISSGRDDWPDSAAMVPDSFEKVFSFIESLL